MKDMPELKWKNWSQYVDGQRSTWTVLITVVALLAFAGFEHGFFEALQGNRATGGFFIQAIGESIRWWQYGDEGAFTLVPNFLITGILAMLFAVATLVWAIVGVRRKRGGARSARTVRGPHPRGWRPRIRTLLPADLHLRVEAGQSL